MFTDINAFIAELDRRKELARIAEPVDPDLEIAAVIDRVSQAPGGGPGAAVREADRRVDAGRRESVRLDVAHLPGARRRAPRRPRAAKSKS